MDGVKRLHTAAPLLLELDLTEPLIDAPPTDPLGWAQARRHASLRAVLDGLTDAADDPRVRGLIAKIGGRMSLVRAQDIAAAVGRFRRSGKPAVAWAETFGEFGPGTVSYLLATAFEQVWLQPSGDVGLTGVAVEATFLRGVLDRVGVEPQLGQRHEYKNAADQLMRRDFSDAHREAAGRLAESALEQVVAGVSAGRGLSLERVRELVDQAPLPAAAALEAGLVDRLGYRDEVYAYVRERVGDDAELRYVSRYERPGLAAGVAGTAGRSDLAGRVGDAGRQVLTGVLGPRGEALLRRLPRRSDGVVALITGSGAVQQGRGRRSPLGGGSGLGSDQVSAAFRSAVRDPKVKAIVFRVDSPGGSYIASDVIWREVRQARAAGIPVVVSMGDLAASGGYFVSMAADVIVARPGTLTGSIGVFGGKAVTAGLLDRIGVGHDAVIAGRNARMFSSRRPFDDGEWQRLNDWLDRVYADFVTKVADGRGMTWDEAHDRARGRVWTGADAKERGLVDELGGLHRAAELARERAGLSADAELRRWPASSPLDWLATPKSSEDRTAVTGYQAGWGSFADLASRLGLPADGPLTMPGLRLV